MLCSLSPREGEHVVVMSDNLPTVLCFERKRAKKKYCPLLHPSGCRPVPLPQQAPAREMGSERAQPE
eukprot:4796389-Pyramimonas_sp.AAC.1